MKHSDASFEAELKVGHKMQQKQLFADVLQNRCFWSFFSIKLQIFKNSFFYTILLVATSECKLGNIFTEKSRKKCLLQVSLITIFFLLVQCF